MKNTKIICIKVTESMEASITNLLDNLPRKEYKNKSELIRELIEIGLEKMWKQTLKDKG